MKIRIYQINFGRDEKKVAFMGIDEREHYLESPKVDSSIYDCVFSGEVNCNDLEEVFQKFNIAHPENYKGRSMSVSDVVEIRQTDKVEKGFYYCDIIGFSKIKFDPDKTKPIQDSKISVLMVEPGKKAYETRIGTSLEEMYTALGCDCIQTFYPYDDLVVIVCDDEGKLNGSKPNRAIYDEYGQMIDIICGKFFIADCSTSYFKSLSNDMMKKYKKQFLLPERFCRINGELVAIKFQPDSIKD